MRNFISKDDIKNNLDINQVADLIAELGGDPIIKGDTIVSKTICHNGKGHGSHKLYYYDNTKLFKCYTDCNDTFDIFDLVSKVYSKEDGLYSSIKYVSNFFGFDYCVTEDFTEKLEDWKVLEKYDTKEKSQNKFKNKYYDYNVIKFYPTVQFEDWQKEGIDFNTIINNHIHYNPIHHSILIPHYNIENKLVGIRERTLVKENEKYGKYKPAIIDGVMYNHALGFNLYNINNSFNNIKRTKKAIVFEGEKSPLLFQSYFGKDNDISVACCGSNITNYQFDILYSLGIEELIVAFDKQFETPTSEEYAKWTKKLTLIYEKFCTFVNVSFIFDNDDVLEYKMSPIDNGKNNFLKLFKNRININ